ncbi:MAG: TolC family protein, partial [Ferruginibacter sp.]
MATFTPAASQQHYITLPAAIDTAMISNLSILSGKLQTVYSKQVERTAWDIPFTSIQGEYGQVNSLQNDSKFSVSQSFSFPIVYKRQRELYQSETAASLLNEKVLRATVKKQVAFIYNDLVSILQKIRLLKKTDSLYDQFLQKQEQRFAAGEVNVLERATAAAQRMQAADQLQKAEYDFLILQRHFSYLLNSQQLYLPSDSNLVIPLLSLPDTSVLNQ